MEKSIVTFAMIWIGVVVLLAETTWLVDAREFIRGKLQSKPAAK